MLSKPCGPRRVIFEWECLFPFKLQRTSRVSCLAFSPACLSFLAIFPWHRSFCVCFRVSILVLYIMPISLRTPALSMDALLMLLTCMFSGHLGLLVFPFCSQILMENGTKAGGSLLMDARDLVVNVRFFLLPSPYPPSPTCSHQFLALPWKAKEVCHTMVRLRERAYGVIMI